MNYKCPECCGDIYVRRIDDGEILVKIEPDGSGVKELSNDSNGSTAVFCSKHCEHHIPQEMQDNIMDIFWGEGY